MELINTSPLVRNILIHLIAGVLPALTIVILGSALIGIEIKAKQILPMLLLSWIPFRIVGVYHVPAGLNALVLVVCMAIMCYLFLKVNVIMAISIPIIGDFLWAILELPIIDILDHLFGINELMISQSSSLTAKFFVLLVVGGALLLLAYISRRYKLNLKRILCDAGVHIEDQHGLTNNLFAIIMLLLSPIMLLNSMTVILDELVEGNSINYYSIYKSSDIILILILSASTLYALIKIFKIIGNEFSLKSAVEQMSFLEKLIYNIRRQRHDFNNHLQTVYGLLETKEYDNAREYIKKITNVMIANSELIKTDNPVISSLLYNKIGLAELKNIDIKLTISGSLIGLPISNHELNSVFGNLLDNAMDAVEINGLVDKRISLHIIRDKNTFSLSITSNSCINEEVLENMFKRDFSTKGHPGLGLSIIKDIVDKYGGKLDVLVDGTDTTFSSSIPLGLA